MCIDASCSESGTCHGYKAPIRPPALVRSGGARHGPPLLSAPRPVSHVPQRDPLLYPDLDPRRRQRPVAPPPDLGETPGAGPWPTVLVHPDGSATAAEMRGVLWDLASRGYLAVAADYRRLHDGTYRRTLFPWCEEAESTAVLEVLGAQPWVDPQRLAALGFSQGGIFSLLLAAQTPVVKAVIAYYPVTDFPRWLTASHTPLLQRLIFRFIREYFRRDAEGCPEVPFQTMLDRASALYQAERIQVPVLLIHGDQDGAAPVDESQRLAARLAALGRDVELVVIAGGHHVFNFKHPAQAQAAWQVTLQWLARHLAVG